MAVNSSRASYRACSFSESVCSPPWRRLLGPHVQSGIVCQHRKYNVSVSSRGSGALCQGSAGIHEGLGLVGGAIPNRHIMPGAHQIRGDRRGLIAKTDESDLHCVLSC